MIRWLTGENSQVAIFSKLLVASVLSNPQVIL